MSDNNPKVIYSARIEKESALLTEQTMDKVMQRPQGENDNDLINTLLDMDSKSAHHARAIKAKAECSVGLGFDILDANGEPAEFNGIANERGEALSDVLTAVALDYEGCGNGYLEIVRGKGGSVVELYHAPAREMWVARRDLPFDFLQRASGGFNEATFKRFNPEERESNSIIHFKNPTHKSRHYGLPDWAGCVPDIELDYYAVCYNRKFFINSGVPDIAIVIEGGNIDDDTMDAITSFFRKNIKGIDNAHKTLIMPVDSADVRVRFEKLAIDSKNMDGSFEKLRQRCRDNIISAHGVPPRIAGIIQSGSLGSGGENEGQLQLFQQLTITPRQQMYQNKLKPVIESMGIGANIRFKQLETTVKLNDTDRATRLAAARLITVNEARAMLGMEPIDGGDTLPGDANTEQVVKSIRKAVMEL